MCGLIAIFGYRTGAPPVDSAELITIRDHMISRGPDGCGAWVSENRDVGLGHRRLAIIDTSADGLQPMTSTDGSIRLIFNGEIYNFRELRQRLLARGYRFRTQTDTEVLIAGWQEWGEQLVDHLRGMYAFALWDDKRQGLFVARDPFGIKPLYIADDGKSIRIASQVKALVAGGNVDTQPCPAGNVGYFLWGNVPEPHTLYRGIKSFPAGTACWIARDFPHRYRVFSSVQDLLLNAERNSLGWSKTEIQERINVAVADSVRRHLVADVPIGLFLSSGIDSCALTAVASESASGQLHTLTLGFEEYRGQSMDETPLAEVMARQVGASHETQWVKREHFESEMEAFFAAMDQPTQDGLNTWLVCRSAKRAGLKVAISGLGGDEFLGGYPSFRQVPRLVKSLGFTGPLSSTLGKFARQVSAPWVGHLTSAKYAGLLEYGATYAGAYLLRRALFMPWELSTCLPQELIQEGLPQILAELRDQEPSASLLAKGRVSLLEATLYMRNQLLRDSDWASMAHSIELRVPLVDLEVLAASSRASKQHLAQVPKKALPSAIVSRPKTGFTTPVRDWTNQLSIVNGQRGLRGWAQFVHKQSTPGLA